MPKTYEEVEKRISKAIAAINSRWNVSRNGIAQEFRVPIERLRSRSNGNPLASDDIKGGLCPIRRKLCMTIWPGGNPPASDVRGLRQRKLASDQEKALHDDFVHLDKLRYALQVQAFDSRPSRLSPRRQAQARESTIRNWARSLRIPKRFILGVSTSPSPTRDLTTQCRSAKEKFEILKRDAPSAEETDEHQNGKLNHFVDARPPSSFRYHPWRERRLVQEGDSWNSLTL